MTVDRESLVRIISALFLGTLAYLALVRSLGFGVELLAPSLSGLIVGLVLKEKKAFFVALGAFLLGELIFSFDSESTSILTTSPISILLAAGAGLIAALFSQNKKGETALLLLVALVLVINVTGSAIITLNSAGDRHVEVLSVKCSTGQCNFVLVQKLDYFWREPVDESYRQDGLLFLKTYFLMKKGKSYYPAMAEAFDKTTNYAGVYPGLVTWRLPTLFVLWKFFFPRAIFIYFTFTLLSLLSILASYLFLRRFLAPVGALFGPLLLTPHLIFPIASGHFTFADYWAFFPGFLTFLLFAYRQRMASLELGSIILAFFSALIREHFLFLAAAGLIARIFSKNWKKLILWTLPFLGFAAAYFLHYLKIRPFMKGNPLDLSRWLNGGFSFLNATMRFGENFFPLTLLLFYLLLILAFIGTILLSDNELRLFCLAVLVIPISAFMFIGGSLFAYWGATYKPFILILAPLSFQLFPHLKSVKE